MKTLANIKIKIARMGLRQKTVTFAMIFFLKYSFNFRNHILCRLWRNETEGYR